MLRRIVPLLVLMLAFAGIVSAQGEIVPGPGDEINPQANISWPPPVYVVQGEVDIRGTANLPNMNNYFLEFRPIPGLTPGEQGQATATPSAGANDESPWFPVTLPRSTPVVDDVLGTWNTETAADGVYELRLTINVPDQPSVNFIVSPIRVENEPPPFVQASTPTATPTQDSVFTQPTATRQTRPTLAPSPTPFDDTPTVTANVDANVRSGDGTEYPVIDALLENQSAEIIGISSAGSGWYLIRLEDGTEGWIAPSIVRQSGDLRGVPRVSPPPPPATPTPTPLPATGNLSGSSPSLSPNPPTCNVSFQIAVNITNSGSQATSGPVTVLVEDIHVASGTVNASFTEVVPVLNPGDNFVVSGTVTVTTFYNEQHRVVATIDTGNNVIETNEGDNVLSTTYTLQRGGC